MKCDSFGRIRSTKIIILTLYSSKAVANYIIVQLIYVSIPNTKIKTNKQQNKAKQILSKIIIPLKDITFQYVHLHFLVHQRETPKDRPPNPNPKPSQEFQI